MSRWRSTAQRGEVYSGRFNIPGPGDGGSKYVNRDGEIEIVATDHWLSTLDADVLATGPALVKLADRLPAAARVAPRERWLPTAASIGRLAACALRAASRTVCGARPLLLTAERAEEKWESRAT